MDKRRKYFPEPFEITTWENLEKELKKLLAFEISSKEDLLIFWETVSELVKILEDKVAWLYINMTRFADKPEHKKAFNDFMVNVIAKNEPFQFELKKKFYSSPLRKQLPAQYDHLNKIIADEIELFREENVTLSVKEEELIARYGEITSKMTVLLDGEEKTIQQLAPYLEKQDRTIREKVWKLMFARYAQDQDALDILFDQLKNLRIQMAKNAGFENYRDFAHRDKGRFSYTPEDLLKLHGVIEKIIVPFVEEFNQERKRKLGIEILKPWDFNAEINGEIPRPFSDHNDLTAKGIKAIQAISPLFGAELERMQKNGFLDLENRKGKAPGGYCYPIYEYGSSFIFMHAVGVRRDVETFVHEAGHAMHNMLSKDIVMYQYSSSPSEVAELASMSMELISFEHWKDFYAPDVLNALRHNELMEKIKFLPWGVVGDAFQHWIYTNPEHTPKERGEYFASLLDRFKIGGDWNGLEKEKAMRWMMQLHIFQFPFYYIEYVMAQLGAIGVYRNYRNDPVKALAQYENFLKLGYSKSVSEVYEAAGVPFDFSEKYISELVEFLRGELKKDF
jgi:oligoendopeptidase F